EPKWVSPEKQAGEPDATKPERAMRAITMIPNRIVDEADCSGDDHDDSDIRYRAEAREEEQEHGKRHEMIGRYHYSQQTWSILPKRNRINAFKDHFAEGGVAG